MADDVVAAFASDTDAAGDDDVVYWLAADFVAESESLEGHNTTAKDVMESDKLVSAH